MSVETSVNVSIRMSALDEKTYGVRVSFSSAQSAGAGRCTFSWVDLNDTGWQEIGSAARLDAIQRVGARLYQLLLTGEAARAFGMARSAAVGEGLLLRIFLDLQAEALLPVPWEALFDGRGFLALSPSTSVIRCIGRQPEKASLQTTLPLRALIVSPSHRGDRASEVGWLASLTEKSSQAEVRVSSAQIAVELLAEAIQGFHTVHYVGSLSKDGLIWSAEDILRSEVIATAFGPTIAKIITIYEDTVSEHVDRLSALHHVATTLVRHGVSGVVAICGEMDGAVRARFLWHLYLSLSSERSLDAAVGEARREVNVADRPGSSWMLPVLYMAFGSGRFFRFSAAPAPESVAAAWALRREQSKPGADAEVNALWAELVVLRRDLDHLYRLQMGEVGESSRYVGKEIEAVRQQIGQIVRNLQRMGKA